MHFDLLFTDGGLEMVSGAQPRSAVGCSVLFYSSTPVPVITK
ncbi:hypothetical protein [Rubritalea tangerina]